MSAALQFARDVIAMQDRICELEYQLARAQEFEHKYKELLSGSLEHNQQMVGQLFHLGMQVAREHDERNAA